MLSDSRLYKESINTQYENENCSDVKSRRLSDSGQGNGKEKSPRRISDKRSLSARTVERRPTGSSLAPQHEINDSRQAISFPSPTLPSSSTAFSPMPQAKYYGYAHVNMKGGNERPPSNSSTSKQEPSPSNSGRKYSKDDFEFSTRLGSGAYSSVYLARFKLTGKKYAAKVILKKKLFKENKIETVKTEKNVLNIMNHQNIVSLFCTFQDAENLYLILELAPGGEMFHILSKNGPLTLEATQFYIAELVLAMEYMHSLGIVHRDLKPENILLSRWMRTKITDFGTAKIENEPVDQVKSESGARRKKTFCGTAEYVSPEILKGENVNMACDLWALGCILYQYLTGSHPFKAESEYLIFQKILHRELYFPQNFPTIARDLCERLLQLNPEDRLGYGVGGYNRLKAHPFFNSIDWDELPNMTPPEILKRDLLKDTPVLSPSSSMNNLPSQSSTLSDRSLSSTAHTMMKTSSSGDFSRWMPFLVRGEEIVHTGGVIKRRRLSSKKRQLILTSTPRLFYIDPAKNIIKGSIPFTSDMKVEKKSDKYFHIRTPGRTYVLECPEKDVNTWVESIIRVQNLVFSLPKR